MAKTYSPPSLDQRDVGRSYPMGVLRSLDYLGQVERLQFERIAVEALQYPTHTHLSYWNRRSNVVSMGLNQYA